MYRYVIGPVNFDVRKPAPISLKLEKMRTIGIDLCNVSIGRKCEDYTGTYTITPRVYEQIMETEDKHMAEDVHILQIPLTQVSNIQGGWTATIG